MADAKLRLAVISADHAFRSTIADVLHSQAELAAVVTDLGKSARELTQDSLDQLQADDSDVVLVDISGSTAEGLRVVQQLNDAAPARTLIATGPLLTPELLLDGMKAGIAEYLPAPVDAQSLIDALRRAARRLGRAGGHVPAAAGRVITFVGAKGGTGVTTAVANTALQLHRTGKGRTLLVDLNLDGGNLSVAMGLKPRYSLVDLFENFHRVDESLLSSLVVQHPSGVHVLPAPLLPESAPRVTSDQTSAVLRLLRRHYDLIVIDLARPYTDYGRAALDHSDLVFLLLVPDVLAVHGAKRLLPLIRKGIEARDGRVEVVLNRVGAEDQIQKHDVQQALETRVVHMLRRDDATVLSSLNMGKPITLNGSRSRYAKDVRALCAHVSGKRQEPQSNVDRLMKVFSRAKGH